MRNIKSAISILLIGLLLITSFSSIISAGDYLSPEFVSQGSDTKDIYLYNWTGCYDLYPQKNVESFKVYCHIPIIVDGQSPIIINDVWTEPVSKVIGFSLADDYSGLNSLLEVHISGLNSSENVKLFWSISSIVKGNYYNDLPNFIKKTPRRKLPNDVKKWLLPSKFIQSNHWRIKLRARLLRGFSNNVIEIAENVAHFTGEEIEYKGGKGQDALSTLKRGYAVCTGKANLAAALLRANDIPARVLMVYPTHYIVEFYAHPYGWIRMESTVGIMPYPNHYYTVAFCAYPRDETFLNIVNGQHPYSGVIAYWGTSNRNVYQGIDYSNWSLNYSFLLADVQSIDESVDTTQKVWNYYTNFLGEDLSEEQEEHFLNATNYQKTAVSCFENENFNGYIENIILSCNEYKKIKSKTRGVAVGSDIVGDESSVSESLTFIDDCDINMLIVDFGWITWSWGNTKFDEVANLINETKQRNISVWLMYRARVIPGDGYKLPHQVHKDGTVDERDICFSHKKCRDWSISWVHKLLEKYPNVDGIIIYNPRFLPDCCYCRYCVNKFRLETRTFEFPRFFRGGTEKHDRWMEWRAEEITDFIKGWKDEITTSYPQIQTGAVLLPSQYGSFGIGQDLSRLGDILDMIFPFVVLDNVADDNIAGQICNGTKDVVSCKVVADIKIFGPYTNTDSDIVNAVRSSMGSKGDGFFIWCYDCLDPEIYDIEKIKNAYNGVYH